ncbi:MAG: hypothetical protein AB7D07_03450 [Desulfovibrionaceae bacterium]
MMFSFSLNIDFKTYKSLWAYFRMLFTISLLNEKEAVLAIAANDSIEPFILAIVFPDASLKIAAAESTAVDRPSYLTIKSKIINNVADVRRIMKAIKDERDRFNRTSISMSIARHGGGASPYKMSAKSRQTPPDAGAKLVRRPPRRRLPTTTPTAD